ncbi:hypothetical protein CYMTET_33549, partial [Cymbomonas tetramitiformis]
MKPPYAELQRGLGALLFHEDHPRRAAAWLRDGWAWIASEFHAILQSLLINADGSIRWHRLKRMLQLQLAPECTDVRGRGRNPKAGGTPRWQPQQHRHQGTHQYQNQTSEQNLAQAVSDAASFLLTPRACYLPPPSNTALQSAPACLHLLIACNYSLRLGYSTQIVG